MTRYGWTVTTDGRTSHCGHLHQTERAALSCACSINAGQRPDRTRALVRRAKRRGARPVRLIWWGPEVTA